MPSITRFLLRPSSLPSLVAIAFLPLPALAADALQDDAAASKPRTFDQSRFGGVTQTLADWNVIIGAGAMLAPKFEGSDEMEISPVPVITAKIGDRVSIDPGGVSVDIYSADNFKFGLRGGYDLGRAEDDSDHLRGLGDIDAGGVVGASFAYEAGPVELFARIDKTIGGSDGLTGKVGASVSHQVDRFIFSAEASATWADDNHMESYFGVTKAQSARSGLAEYEAGAGFKRVDLEASVTYMVTQNWLVRGQAGVGLLTGDAADSPIVQDEVQPSAMLMLGYKF